VVTLKSVPNVLDMENFLEGWPLAAPPLPGYRL